MNKLTVRLNWKEIKMIPVYLMALYVLFIIIQYILQDPGQNATKPSTYLILILGIGMTFIALFENQNIKSFYQKYAVWIDYMVLVLSPIASFFIVESMVSNFNRTMFLSYGIYNLVWYIALYYLVFALLRSIRYTIAICNIVVYIASVVNYFVYLFRGNPILPSDLLAWQTGMSVASNYEVSFSQGFLISTLLMYSVFVLSFKLEKKERKVTVVNRLFVIGTYVVFAVFVFRTYFNTDFIKSQIRVLDFFAPKYTYCSYGTVFGFVANVQAMETQEPEGYSVDKVENILNNTSYKEVEASDQEKPNIIVIMNEAFSDLSMIGDFDTNMDYLFNIHALKKNTIKGSLFVSVFGGATSDTEYEFLTGNSMAVMPQNCVPYQQFVTNPTDSLATTLKAQGYYNIAIHPYEPSGYKRDLVYPLLGFDEFLSKDDFENPTLIRSFISDRDSYQKIIEQYEEKEKDGPLFIFNVTMQNHGGYSGTQIFDDANTVRLTDYTGFSGVEQYLSLLRESDKAFQSLIDYFSKQKEHTIIMLYGDHQPVVYADLMNEMASHGDYSEDDLLKRKYTVPFILWANYNIGEEENQQISANFLSSYLLQTAGLKGTVYNQYLMDLYQQIPVMNALFYIDKNNNFHSYADMSEYRDMITNYKYVGYNNALDQKNRLDQFYYLK